MSDAARQKLLRLIDDRQEAATGFLQQMIAIPSVTGDEGAIQKFLAQYMTLMGLEVDLWETDWEALKKHPAYIPVDRGYEGRPNIVATMKGTGGGRSLLLTGTPTSFRFTRGWAGATTRGRPASRTAASMGAAPAT